jgi:hypothetical protein
MKTERNRIAILQRADGAVFTRTAALEARADMHPGIQINYDDGTSSVELDQATVKDLDPNTISGRERALMAENAELRERLAQALGMKFNNSATAAKPFAPEAPKLAPGETLLPPPPASFADLTRPAVVEDEPLVFAPEPTMLSESKLGTMNKTTLTAHARDVDRTVVIPDEATKAQLIDICVQAQKAYQARVNGTAETPVE